MSVAENIFTSLWNLLENGAIKGKNIDHVTMHHEVNVRCKKLRKWQNKKEEEVNGSGREQTRVVLLWSTSSNAQYKSSIPPPNIFVFVACISFILLNNMVARSSKCDMKLTSYSHIVIFVAIFETYCHF